MAENLAKVDYDYPVGQDIIRSLDNPIKKDSHLVVLYGNLAPDGAVAKISGKEGEAFTGRARRPARRGACVKKSPTVHEKSARMDALWSAGDLLQAACLPLGCP